MNDWKDIKDAPKGNLTLLILGWSGHGAVGLGWWSVERQTWVDHSGPLLDPTHYQDCPKPPQSD